MDVLVGARVPLSLQITTGDATLKPTAVIHDDLAKVLAEVQLVSFGGGLYMCTDFQMPECHFIVVQYQPNNSEYEITEETFKAIPKPSPGEKYLTGELTSRVKSKKYYTGVLQRENKIKE